MARPQKTGLDYYPQDTDQHNDYKIKFIKAEIATHPDYGKEYVMSAYGIIKTLMELLYHDGCFLDWEDQQKKMFCLDNYIDINFLNVVINAAFDCKFFCREVFERTKKLTSTGFQKRYCAATGRRHEVQIPAEILIIEVSEYNNVIIVDNNEINTNAGTQSKVKESKGKNKNILVNVKPVDQPPDCPHSKIIDLYHEILPELPRISTVVRNGQSVYNWNGDREKHLKCRWRESERRQTLEWWSGYFNRVKESDFLMGRKEPAPGRTLFMADLGWLIKPSNFNKVVEGKYNR